jgi:hypothetical protein
LWLSSEKLVSSICFQINLYRYAKEAQAKAAGELKRLNDELTITKVGGLYKLHPVGGRGRLKRERRRREEERERERREPLTPPIAWKAPGDPTLEPMK